MKFQNKEILMTLKYIVEWEKFWIGNWSQINQTKVSYLWFKFWQFGRSFFDIPWTNWKWLWQWRYSSYIWHWSWKSDYSSSYCNIGPKVNWKWLNASGGVVITYQSTTMQCKWCPMWGSDALSLLLFSHDLSTIRSWFIPSDGQHKQQCSSKHLQMGHRSLQPIGLVYYF